MASVYTVDSVGVVRQIIFF